MAPKSKRATKCACDCHKPAPSANSRLCDECKSMVTKTKKQKPKRRQRKQRKSRPTNYGAQIHNQYSRNIYKLLKCIYPDLSITRMAMNVMNSFFMDLLDRIASEASTLVYLSKKSTMTYNDIISATKLVIKTPELRNLAVDAAHDTIGWYDKH